MLAPLQKTRDTMSKYVNKTMVQSNSVDTDIEEGGGGHRTEVPVLTLRVEFKESVRSQI